MNSLQDARYISFATWRRNGNEVRTPVWFAAINFNTFYCFSAADAGKVKRLRHSDRSRVATCNAGGGNIGKWTESKAYLVSNPEEIQQAYTLLKQKYGLQMAITNLLSWMSGRINNREVIRIELGTSSEG